MYLKWPYEIAGVITDAFHSTSISFLLQSSFLPLLTCSVGVDVVVVHADASFAMKLVRMSHELDWLSTVSLTSEAGSSDW